MYGTVDWYLHLKTVPGLKDLNRDISTACNFIAKRGELVTASKVVSELTLGFWVQLLNAEYELILWKGLRKSFPFMPKKDRKRHKVSAPVNQIRNFRNRVYHNQPVCWNFKVLEEIHQNIYEILGWINKDIPEYAERVDRFKMVLEQAKIKLV